MNDNEQPTPPADDIREALAATVKRISQKFGGPSLAEFANDPPTRKHYATVDAILAAFVVTEVPGGCFYCSSSGVIEDYEGDHPCSNCDGTGTPRPYGTVNDAFAEYVEHLGVDANEDHDGDWWDGYRQAQRDNMRHATAALEAAREVRPRGPVTAAKVEAALEAFIGGPFDFPESRPYWEPRMRAALEAAREVRS